MILDARKSLADPKANPIAQASALKLLSNQEFANTQELFKVSLESSKTPMVHQAALEALAKYEGSDAALLVISAWPGLGPKAKATALEALLSRNSSTDLKEAKRGFLGLLIPIGKGNHVLHPTFHNLR